MKLKIFNLNNQGNKRNMYTHENTCYYTCYSNMNWENICVTQENIRLKKCTTYYTVYSTRIMLQMTT